MKRKKTNILMFLLILSITIGYATFSTVLKTNSTTHLGDINYLVIFDNLVLSGNNLHDTDVATINPADKTKMTFNVLLENPDDYVILDFDMLNVGTLNAKITNIDFNITNGASDLLDISFTDENGNDIYEGLLIQFYGVNKKKGRIKIIYNLGENITQEDLDKTGQTFEMNVSIDFEYYNILEFYTPEGDDPNPYESPKSVLIHSVDLTKNAVGKLSVIDYLLDDDDYPYAMYIYNRQDTEDNTNVIIDGMCWKVITKIQYDEDYFFSGGGGGIKGESKKSSGQKSSSYSYYYDVYSKLLFNGYPNEYDQCLSTGDDVFIGKSPYSLDGSYSFETSPIKDTLTNWINDNISHKELLAEGDFVNNNTYDENNPEYKFDENTFLSKYGLLSVQEANVHGLTTNSSSNSFIGTNAAYWLLSGTNDNKIWAVGENNNLVKRNSTESLGIRPVIYIDQAYLYDNYTSVVVDCDGERLTKLVEDTCYKVSGTKEHPIKYIFYGENMAC